MKSAKEMFEELGYGYSKINNKIYWEQPAIFELGEPTPYVMFDLINKKWDKNIVKIEKDKELIQAINKQVEELGWNDTIVNIDVKLDGEKVMEAMRGGNNE